MVGSIRRRRGRYHLYCRCKDTKMVLYLIRIHLKYMIQFVIWIDHVVKWTTVVNISLLRLSITDYFPFERFKSIHNVFCPLNDTLYCFLQFLHIIVMIQASSTISFWTRRRVIHRLRRVFTIHFLPLSMIRVEIPSFLGANTNRLTKSRYNAKTTIICCCNLQDEILPLMIFGHIINPKFDKCLSRLWINVVLERVVVQDTKYLLIGNR
mmetsp:Transcript_8552/g.16117  ORF Transcript_8552/g.16117 Transcript_8552/m.16117 type:complete len:209 (+) Transcript_8552:784-1410(+)